MAGDLLAKIRDRTGFDRLEPREKVVILVGAGIFFLFLVLQFGLGPYLEASANLNRSLQKRKADIVELQLLQQEYRQLQAEAGGIREQLQKRPPSFSLFTFIDKQAATAEVKDSISYMKPSTMDREEDDLLESMVEMKLQEIGLDRLVTFLKGIESPENVVSIRRISIQQNSREEGLLDVVIQIVTFVDKASG